MGNYLVTGGAGFIGSHITETLLSQGHTVRVLDNFSTGKRENLKRLQTLFPLSLQIVRGDIRNKKLCERTLSGMDYAFHQAAAVSVPKSVEDPETTHQVNITGTLNILLAAKKAGLKKVVFASSSAVYGDETLESKARKPKHENLPPNPLSPYGLSKLVGETYCRLFSRLYGLATHSLRYFNVFGPRQDPRSEYAAVIPKFVSALLSDSSPIIFGDGKQSRDFVYVGDVVQANLKACHLAGSAGEVFNVAMGRAYTLLQLLRTLQKITKKENLPVFAPPRPGDIRHSRAATQKIQKMLGYRPQCDLRQGLVKTVESLAAANEPGENKASRSSSGKTVKPF